MIESIFYSISNNFVVFSALVIITATVLTSLLLWQNYGATGQFLISIFAVSLLLFGFWIKMSRIDVKTYSYYIPLSHLIIVFLSGFLLFNSIRRYQISYSKIEFRLIIFYLINYLVWFILFLQDIFTIGVSDISNVPFLKYLGWLLLILSLAAALSVYYIGKSIFFMKYPGDRIVENIMFVVYGFIIGITLADLNDSIIINAESFYQQTFIFPDLFKPYAFLILAFLFLPYLIVAYKARSAIRLMEQSKKNGGMIDPVAIPRLKLTEISMYVYIFGAGFALGLTILPGFVEGFILPFGLNTLLSVPFIAIVDLTLFLAFQTPDRLKNYWRMTANSNLA